MGWHRARQELSSSACGVAAIRSEVRDRSRSLRQDCKAKAQRRRSPQADQVDQSAGVSFAAERAASSWSASETAAPASANALAVARPIPEAAPVTSATLSLERPDHEDFALDRVIRLCGLLQIRWPIARFLVQLRRKGSGGSGLSLRFDDLNSVGGP